MGHQLLYIGDIHQLFPAKYQINTYSVYLLYFEIDKFKNLEDKHHKI
jgi:hypothetical protein